MRTRCRQRAAPLSASDWSFSRVATKNKSISARSLVETASRYQMASFADWSNLPFFSGVKSLFWSVSHPVAGVQRYPFAGDYTRTTRPTTVALPDVPAAEVSRPPKAVAAGALLAACVCPREPIDSCSTCFTSARKRRADAPHPLNPADRRASDARTHPSRPTTYFTS